LVPTKDLPPSPRKEERSKPPNTERDIPTRENDIAERIKQLEEENKRIRERLRSKERLVKENDELRRKIKNEEYDAVNSIKERIDNGRK